MSVLACRWIQLYVAVFWIYMSTNSGFDRYLFQVRVARRILVYFKGRQWSRSVQLNVAVQGFLLVLNFGN